MSNSTRQSLLLLSHYYRICIYICTRLFACVLVLLLNEICGYFYVNWPIEPRDTFIQHVLFLLCYRRDPEDLLLTSSWWQLDLAHVDQDSVGDVQSIWATDLPGGEPIQGGSSQSLLLGPGGGDSVPACNRTRVKIGAQCNARLAHRSFGYLPSNQACRCPPDSRNCVVRNPKFPPVTIQNFREVKPLFTVIDGITG